MVNFRKIPLYGEARQSRKVSAFTLSERFYQPYFKTPSHAHGNSLFCYVVGGSYTEHLGRRNIQCSPSNFLFHANGVSHAEHYHRNGGHAFIVEIENAWLRQIREQIKFPEHSIDFTNSSLPHLGAKLYREFMHFDSLSPLIVEGLMMEIAGEGARQTYEKGYGVPTWMNKAVTLLKERSKESLTLAEIADFAGVHPIHLAQTFRKTQGLTVGQFLRRERLENARHDLLKTEKLLAEIAFDNGFADQSHFSRLFKQKFGTTPAVYRRNHKR